jgi:hypothetical protein
MKKIIAITLMLLPTYLWAQSDSTGALTLSEGTIIKAELTEALNGKSASVGETIPFVLADDIVLNNKVVVQKGAKITGTITEAERSKALGKKGKLAFSIDYMYLPNGKVVKLRSQIAKNLKGSGAAVAAGALLVSPVALLFNGKNAKYEKGIVFNAYVDKDTPL